MDARYKELLANLKTSTSGDKSTIDYVEFRVFLYSVNELITSVKVEAVKSFTNELACNFPCVMSVGDVYGFAEQYTAKVRHSNQSGTWLKDSNVNGGKRQGGAE